MTENKINIFLRIRPTKKQLSNYEIVDDGQGLVIDIPKENQAVEVINNTKERHEFRFNKVFDREARQEEIFQDVALPAVTAALDGFNGTIFAYGQTGSGKTFTMTGGPEKYADRGIIPRTLSHIYNELRRRSDFSYQIHVSYLEIYNNNGYDLLDPSLEEQAKQLEDLPKVSLQEDEDGNIHLKNLSAHHAPSEEEALNLLFLGDTIRTTSETPMNLASSRSHCIFTLFITACKVGTDVIRKSKLHLVDLAGSERVYKTSAQGSLLKESKYINVSLHFLEMVIVALQERSQGKNQRHIPYRNSMMTSVLRDSLGGNCKTSMIATMNPEKAHIDESTSTCRFAQRVAMVSNVVKVNEEIDPQLVIKRLKKEVSELRQELALLKGAEEEIGEITEETRNHLKELVSQYISDTSPDAELDVGPHMGKIKACFALLKEMCLQGAGSDKPSKGSGGAGSEEQEEKIRKLTAQIKQRDNEIVILVNMINEAKKGGAKFQQGAEDRDSDSGNPLESSGSTGREHKQERGKRKEELLFDPMILKDRQKSFEQFRKTYPKNEAIESNKAVLKSKYDEAKGVGEAVNESRSKISEIKSHIEQLRVERAMRGETDATEDDPEERELKSQIEFHKSSYKEKFNRLRELKAEIEQIQGIMEKQRVGLQNDFENWYNLMVRQYRAALKGEQQAGAAQGEVTREESQEIRPGRGGSSRGEESKSVPVLTGNKDADADIAAFYKARQQLLEKSSGQS